MSRGGNNKKIPNKIYFIQKIYGVFLGPYSRKPTNMCDISKGDKMLEWKQNPNGDFIKQTIKNIRKNKLEKINNIRNKK